MRPALFLTVLMLSGCHGPSHDHPSSVDYGGVTDASTDSSYLDYFPTGCPGRDAPGIVDCGLIEWGLREDGREPGQVSVQVILEQPLANHKVSFGDNEVMTDGDGTARSDAVPDAISLSFGEVWIPKGGGSVLIFKNSVAILAPAAGDALAVVHPAPAEYPTSPVLFVGAQPLELEADAGSPAWAAYAGEHGCAAALGHAGGRLKAQMNRRDVCTLETGDNILAVASDDQGPLGFSSAVVPPLFNPPADFLPPVDLDPWVAPEPVPFSLTNSPPWARIAAWVQKQDIRLLLGQWDAAERSSLPLVRSLIDRFDVEVQGTYTNDPGTFLESSRVNYPATQESVSVVFERTLPEVTSVTLPTSVCGDGARLSWTVTDGVNRADAVVIRFAGSRSYRCSAYAHMSMEEERVWTVIAPPDTRSVPTSFVQSPGIGHYVVDITYFDADHQDGYRDFLKEPLRVNPGYGESPSSFALRREPAAGGTVRISRFTPWSAINTARYP